MLPGYPPSGIQQSMLGKTPSYFSTPTTSDRSTAPEGYPSPLMVHPLLSMYTAPSPHGHQNVHYHVTPSVLSTSRTYSCPSPQEFYSSLPMQQVCCQVSDSHSQVQHQHPFQALSPTSLVSSLPDPMVNVSQDVPPVIISSVHSSDYSFNMRNNPPLLPHPSQGMFDGDVDNTSVSGSTINSYPFQSGGFIPSATNSQVAASQYAYQTLAHVSSVGAPHVVHQSHMSHSLPHPSSNGLPHSVPSSHHDIRI